MAPVSMIDEVIEGYERDYRESHERRRYARGDKLTLEENGKRKIAIVAAVDRDEYVMYHPTDGSYNVVKYPSVES